MKRWFCLLLVLGLVLSVAMTDRADADLSKLGKDQLDSLIDEIEDELENHHEPNSDDKDAVLDAVKAAVEAHFGAQDIEVSWPWFDYDYTRDWDFYTLNTGIEYKDSMDEKQKPDVYAEVLCEGEEYTVYYLTIGDEAVVDRQDELPEEHWSSTPESNIDVGTGLDLALISEAGLKELRDQAKDELKTNHETDVKTSDLVRNLMENVVDTHFKEQGSEVSWPWFDYDYTCDWGFYTARAPITVKSDDGKQKFDVYAEAYPIEKQYTLTFLCVGEEVLIDQRSVVPATVLQAAQIDDTVLTVAKPVAAAAEEPPEATAVPATATPAPTETPKAHRHA